MSIDKVPLLIKVRFCDFLQSCLIHFKEKKSFCYSYEFLKCAKSSQTNLTTSQFSSNQINKEPTHIVNSSFSSIDFLFNPQQNLVSKSGVDPSLHPNLDHQINSS